MMRRLLPVVMLVCAAALGGPVSAGGFAASASPSRYELQAKAGEVVSRTLELQHISNEASEYVIRSADWSLTEDRGLEFFDALQPGSCRPWVRLERKTVKIEPRSRRKFRFEVHVPPEATPGECRFALLVENYEQKAVPVIRDAPVNLPLSGRLGVIVYVQIGGAQPKLALETIAIGEDNGEAVPMATVRNDGNAHGRLEGALRGTDASGKTYYFPVSTLPVMPGQTRRLALVPAEDMQSKKRPKVAYPVKLSGRLDWDNGQFDVAAEVRREP
jgi:hypothetical protein